MPSTELGIPELMVDEVDRWVVETSPSVEDVAVRITEMRRLARDARVAEAHLIGYAIETLGEDAAEPLELLGVIADDE